MQAQMLTLRYFITGISAHLMGVTNPMYSCNLYVYNITGCCQTIVSQFNFFSTFPVSSPTTGTRP